MDHTSRSTMVEEIALAERVDGSKVDLDLQPRAEGSHQTSPAYPRGYQFAPRRSDHDDLFRRRNTRQVLVPALSLLGFGIGLGISGPFLAVQAILPEQDTSIGLAIMSFSQVFGIALSLDIAQCLFLNELQASIKRIAPYLGPPSVINAGATSLADAGLEKYASLIAEAQGDIPLGLRYGCCSGGDGLFYGGPLGEMMCR